VVVDDVEKDRELSPVCLGNKSLEVLRRTIASIRGEQVDAIIAPVPGARRVRKGHQLDGGDSEIGEISELLARSGIRACRRESPKWSS